MPPALAIAGAAVVGAGATMIAGNKAAHAQEQAAQLATNEQQRQYDQSRADLAPWRAAGTTALGSLMSAYGIGGGPRLGSAGNTPGAQGTEGGIDNGSGAYGGFFESPGYRWMRDQGMQAIEKSQAAQGLLGSGATIKEEQRYAEGLASGDFDKYTSGLAGIAGLGQSGTSQTVSAGTTAANNISQNLIASGNARASSYANTGSAVNSGINNVMSAYLMNNMGMFGRSGASSYAGGFSLPSPGTFTASSLYG